MPSEQFREHFKIVPFYEDSFADVVKAAGLDAVVNGSDFPHPEGLEWPEEMVDELSGFSAGEVRKIMRDNAAKLLGLGH